MQVVDMCLTDQRLQLLRGACKLRVAWFIMIKAKHDRHTVVRDIAQIEAGFRMACSRTSHYLAQQGSHSLSLVVEQVWGIV